MKSEMVSVHLENLGGGAAVELFEHEWDRLLENILDPNTEAEAKRTLTLKVTVKPQESREMAHLQIDVSTKLAGPRPAGSIVYMGKQDGRTVAVAYDPRQGRLWEDDEQDGEATVTPIHSRQEGE